MTSEFIVAGDSGNPSPWGNADFPLTFRILGSPFNQRRLVDAAVAFDAYRQCDPKARVEEESYLGAFCFGQEFKEHVTQARSTRGFNGRTWAPLIWWDVDRPVESGGLERAIVDTRRLIDTLEENFLVPRECLLTFISGGKGCHLGLPTALWSPPGSESFHKVAREFAVQVAAEAGVLTDAGIYDCVRAFRAPNSRHPRTGLHKKHVTPGGFGVLTADDAVSLAVKPSRFRWPSLDGVGPIARLTEGWDGALKSVVAQQAAFEERQRKLADGTAVAHVNRLTMDLIRGEPVPVGDRHRVIYSASRNLMEAGATRHLVFELLREAALDTGLAPREVDRQIECGCLGAVPENIPSGTRVAANSEEAVGPGPNRQQGGQL